MLSESECQQVVIGWITHWWGQEEGEASESSGSPQSPSPQLLTPHPDSEGVFPLLAWDGCCFSYPVTFVGDLRCLQQCCQKTIWWLPQPSLPLEAVLSGHEVCRPGFHALLPVRACRETLQATLNSRGRHRLVQANPDQSQASELINKECSSKNSWSTWHFIIWTFLLAGSSGSSRVIIMQEYTRQNSKVIVWL